VEFSAGLAAAPMHGQWGFATAFEEAGKGMPHTPTTIAEKRVRSFAPILRKYW